MSGYLVMEKHCGSNSRIPPLSRSWGSSQARTGLVTVDPIPALAWVGGFFFVRAQPSSDTAVTCGDIILMGLGLASHRVAVTMTILVHVVLLDSLRSRGESRPYMEWSTGQRALGVPGWVI